MNELSIVIITYNNYKLKNGTIETLLLSLDAQSDIVFDVIVVDNCSTLVEFGRLERFISKTAFGFSLSLIRNNCNSISKGRNLGVQYAKGDTILFIDDDTIILERDTLIRLLSQAKEGAYGCSAIRGWTVAGWYEANKEELDSFLKRKEVYLNIQLQPPVPDVRRKENTRHLVRSYIGNFGFINRRALEQVGFWNERFIGYGLEDDYMAFLLYINFGEPIRLSTIHVIHIWHEISCENYTQLDSNQCIFEDLLSNYGVKKFHAGRLLYGDGEIVEYM